MKITVALLTLLTLFSLNTFAAVNIPDANLRAKIESALGKAAGATITAEDMATLTELTARRANISNLTGLEHATNLTELRLVENNVSDLSPLAGLTQLRYLSLPNNAISDLSPLAELTKLTSLHLYNNAVSNLSNNTISDLSPLAGLTELRYLSLMLNNVSSLSPLAGLTKLRSLDFGYNNVSSLSPVAELTELRSLDFGYNNVSSLSPVAGLTNLTRLLARGNQISDISALAELTNLTDLLIDGNQISDISALANLTQLQTLWLPNNQISDISALAELTNLTYLLLDENQILDISALANLTKLQTLGLPNNAISDLSPVVGLTKLQTLSLRNNPLSYPSIYTHIPTLQDNGVDVWFTNRIPAGLTIESGNNQDGAISTPLAQPLVVKVTDDRGAAFEGVPVMFAVTKGGGTLSTTSTTTDASGLAESTLTLGSSAGTNTVEVSASMIQQRVIFNAEGSLNGATAQVNIPDANLRAKVLDALDKPTDAQLTLADMENLTRLDARRAGISDLTGLEHATNLTELWLSNNPLSDISALAGLTNLTSLYLSFNQLSDISALAGLAKLESLWLQGNPLSDISVLSGLTNLTILGIHDNHQLSDISELAGLTNLTRLYLSGNQISDISALAGLTNLTILDLARNQILDISALAGLTKLTTLNLTNNPLSNISVLAGLANLTQLFLYGPLSYASIYTHIPTLQDNGVDVRFTNRIPTGLAIDSGNNQDGAISTPLAQPFVVKVTDENDAAFEGVPVTFTVTKGDGTLSATSTTTDADGLAESTLTLGSSAATNTVEVSASRIQPRVVFNAEGSLNGATAQVNIPDATLRAKVLAALDQPTDAQLTLADMANLTVLDARRAGISDLTGLEHATNLTTLWLHGNQLSDISALSGLTNLTRLYLSENQLSDISALSGLTNLTRLYLGENQLSDISALSGLTNLTSLLLGENQLSDISALANLTNLTELTLRNNPLSYPSIYTHIPTLQDNGVDVRFTNRIPMGLAIDSGNNQDGEISTPLTQPLVVKVTDENDAAFEGVPVTFTVTKGDGTLSTTSTTTNADGLAESTLTLGSSAGTNTVEVSASRIQPRVVFNAESTRKSLLGDVNQDGVVNIFDLVLVANRFGQTGVDTADVNEDGVVNILDLVLVAGAFGDTSSAAPSKHPQALEPLTATDVKQWVIQAQGLVLTDATSQRGLIFLEQLLAVLTPSRTTLLPNYPNPFNPETWIPYRLAKDAFVTLTIYDQQGRVVRQINVGHRTAAVYERRDKAIYWDGRNAVGEAVASGVYFYTLTTGDFTATRKMLILK